ncbi:MAG: asparagine synthase (glutamine-hydrolyzing) [Burkholderiales bacterium]
MCGIAGFWRTPPIDAQAMTAAGAAMAEAIRHRGPDDDGVWCDANAGIVLAHRRLAILDVSPEGHQPMVSASGRFVIVFNGEIYNFAELREALERTDPSLPWRGHSDTEVMLAAFERWGVEASIVRMAGMFAFALWDREARTLTLGRDRFGEKPLYYGWSRGVFLFASELKALRAHRDFEARIDRRALAAYGRFACVPGSDSIYAGISKLLPGHVVTFDETRFARRESGRPVPYWSLDEVVRCGQADRFTGNGEEAANALEELLRRTVRAQSVADVPLGAFLSGGIDSSLVVALMQSVAARPVRTFTIGFDESDYDEAADARAVARHLGTHHTEWTLSATEARAVIPELPRLYDEPFADSSQIPTHLVARLARQHVTVSLSGDAGDEMFGGYNRHRLANRLERTGARVPLPLRRLAARGVLAVAPGTWDRLVRAGSRFVPPLARHKATGDRLHKLAGLLDASEPGQWYERLTSFWSSGLVIDGGDPSHAWSRAGTRLNVSLPERMMILDSLGYLPDDILVKVDRAAMATSLETRVPFLDHRVAEFAWRLPLQHKLDSRSGKKILRRLLHRYVPATLVDRPKMGFGIPLDQWLRGPLRPWAESLLAEDRLRREGFFDPAVVRARWIEHVSGVRNWQHHLWIVLMFESWLDTWGPGLAT